MKKQIANVFTLLNLVCGCISIVYALQNGIDIEYTKEGEQFVMLKENIYLASIFIGIAAVIDFLDGFIARLLNIPSAIGEQLDSLADVVSFGVAPGIILYQFLRMGVIRDNEGFEASIGWLLPAFIFTCAGAYRLARFNISESKNYGFKGVPIPAAGLVVASLPLIYWYNNSDFIYKFILNKWFLYLLILLLSWLMVSKLPIMAMKFNGFTLKNNLSKVILIVVALVSAIFLKWIAVPVIFIFYILLSLATIKTKSE